mmetsp:Transcript_36791/g.86364  ORF Transcript_36791/g.86364 Transcript_36791/m.86364 type:complete len:334 (+) Transcript_36791:1539-2540(+)
MWRSAPWTASGALGVPGATAAPPATAASSFATGPFLSRRWEKVLTATDIRRSQSPALNKVARGTVSSTIGSRGPTAPTVVGPLADGSGSGMQSRRSKAAGLVMSRTRSTRLAALRVALATASGVIGAAGAIAHRAAAKASHSGTGSSWWWLPMVETAWAVLRRQNTATMCLALKIAAGTTGASGRRARNPVEEMSPGQSRGFARSQGPLMLGRSVSASPLKRPRAMHLAAARSIAPGRTGTSGRLAPGPAARAHELDSASWTRRPTAPWASIAPVSHRKRNFATQSCPAQSIASSRTGATGANASSSPVAQPSACAAAKGARRSSVAPHAKAI